MKLCLCGHRSESNRSQCASCGRPIRTAPEEPDATRPAPTEACVAPLVSEARAELRVAGDRDYKFVLTAGAIVGRGADVDITTIPDSNYTSRRHARFYVAAGEWWIEPMGSRPTLVGGRRVAAPQQIASGDTITLGGVSFVFTVKP
jgi:pSer/pThr/pTyr-binding forkhead associated (FHA) protein